MKYGASKSAFKKPIRKPLVKKKRVASEGKVEVKKSHWFDYNLYIKNNDWIQEKDVVLPNSVVLVKEGNEISRLSDGNKFKAYFLC